MNERVELYREIEAEYLAGLEAQGVLFASPEESLAQRQECATLIERLSERGAQVRNKGASVHINHISPACIACTGDAGSRTFLLSVRCHRDCYFCFNPNQRDYAEHSAGLNDWRAKLDELTEIEATGIGISHVALTGGEPLLHRQETLDFFKEVRQRYPKAYTRLYTAGDLLDERTLAGLAETKLDEIRFSVKLDDAPELREYVLALLATSRDFVPQVMVEMPVIPGTEQPMRELLRRLDELDIFGINLLELGFPRHNWPAFAERGFVLQNPPFDVLYDYSYAGGLPIAGSELLALRLLDFALDEKMSMGLHYCSLANKHRDQTLTVNAPHAKANPLYELDDGDFFLKSIVAFGHDAEKLARLLQQAPVARFGVDPDDGSLQFNPKDLGLIKALLKRKADDKGSPPDVTSDKTPDVTLYLSYNIIEERPSGPVLRELKLEPL